MAEPRVHREQGLTSCRKEAREVQGHVSQGLGSHMWSLDFALRAPGVLLRICIFEFAYVGCTVAVVGAGLRRDD